MSALNSDPTIPVLSEWMNLTEAADTLGLSRQYVNKIAKKTFKTIHRLGNSPTFVVRRKEVEKVATKRAAIVVAQEEIPAE